jgi:hypothetical protein
MVDKNGNGVEEKGPGAVLTDKLLADLTAKSVFVGIPQAKTNRGKGATITNAELAYIHTHGIRKKEMREEMSKSGVQPYSKAFEAYITAHGSPLWHSPPRPIIEPAIEHEPNKKEIAEQFKKVIEAYTESKEKGDQELMQLGMLGEAIVRDWFGNPANNWAPNSPRTIKEKGSAEPLVDTEQLRKSMTYVIREG